MKIFSIQKNIISSQKGFTLLETLIGIAIVLVAITATFGATQSGLQSAVESRDQIAAFYLAQEGIEYIRNVRDTNGINSQPWLTGIAAIATDPCFPGKSCIVDAVKSQTNPPTACSGGISLPCPYLRQDLTTGSTTYGMYGYTSTGPNPWTLTKFNRQIQIQTVSVNEVAVTVTMKWGNGKTFVARESMFDWQ
jgi:prepilin-type N-terminal cleavage/methylation domain-containing protein